MTLKPEQLLEPDQLETTIVHVPEWARDGDDEVTIRVMDGLAISAYESRMEAAQRDIRADLGDDASDEAKLEAIGRAQHEIRRHLMVEYAAASIIDPTTGNLVYDTPAKIEILGKKRGSGLQKVFNAATTLNRDTPEAAKDFRKNSEIPGVSGSGTNMPLSTDLGIPIASERN